jgi:alpha-beta hydrolase superfamily lysophospholipase
LAGEQLLSYRASDGYAFYVRKFEAAGNPLGRVLILHGIRSHGGWYTRSCRELAAAGYEVHLPDRRGSGLNTARRGDCPSFRRLIGDVTEYAMDLRSHRAGLPLFAAGISWGGKLALGMAARKQGLLDGVGLVAPGLVAAVRPPFVTRLRVLLARLFRPTKDFDVPLNDPELFTSDPHWQQFVRDDPHGLHRATARFLLESFRFDIHLKRAAGRVRTPVLLQLAEHDRILDNPGTRAYLARLTAAKGIDVIDYPGAHHTLEFEPEGHPSTRDLIRWMQRKTPA